MLARGMTRDSELYLKRRGAIYGGYIATRVAMEPAITNISVYTKMHNQVITSSQITSISPMGSDLRFGMPILFA